MDGYQRDIDNKHIRISMFVCLYFDYLCIEHNREISEDEPERM